VVASAEISPDTVTMGATVRYRDGDTGQIFTVTLVYPETENRAASRVSVLSPEGAALIGLSEGQSTRYVTTDGRMKWLIVLRVLVQPAPWEPEPAPRPLAWCGGREAARTTGFSGRPPKHSIGARPV
jgi:regulator of nucleoside diphosphate kinase